MEKVIKRRLDILNILVKRLGDEVGKKAYYKIFKVKDQRPTDGEVIFK